VTELGQEMIATMRSQGWLVATTRSHVITCPPGANRETATKRWPLDWFTADRNEPVLREVLLFLLVQGLQWEDDPRFGGGAHRN